jgi:MFS family permease
MLKKNNLSIIYILGALLAFTAALPSYIQSSFIEQMAGLQYVFIFFIIANVFSIIFLIFFPRIIKKINNYRTTLIVSVLNLISLFALSLATSPWVILLAFTTMVVTAALVWINMDIILELFTKNSNTGKTRTIYFTIVNAGWVATVLALGNILETSNYQFVFFLAAAIMVPFTIILIMNKNKTSKAVNYESGKFRLAIKKTWQNKNLRGVFFLALLLQLFYSLAVVFIPIHLTQNLGFNWQQLGIMFAVMLLPFLFVEIPAGIIADKYLGEKELFKTSLIIIIISLLLFFFTKSTSVFVWTAILFFSRIGAALLEAMRETYFFKNVEAKNISLINLFRVTGPLGYIIGSIMGIIVIKFLPLEYIFLFSALIFLVGFYFVRMIKDTK